MKQVNKIKDILNNPKSIIVFLTIMLAISVFVIYRVSNSSKIYISSIKDENISISTIHAFINNDMHMFYSTSATYNKDDYKIYGIKVGYYIKENNKYKEFLTQSETFDTGESLKTALEFYSSFNYIESNNRVKKFTKNVKNNFEDNLYFIIKVKKDKNTSSETIYEENVNMKKMTK